MSDFIEVANNQWVSINSFTYICIDEIAGNISFRHSALAGLTDLNISVTANQIQAFRANLDKLSKNQTLWCQISKVQNQETQPVRNNPFENAPPSIHIIADHMAQLEDIAGIHLDTDDMTINIVYKKDPKYSQLEIDGKYIVKLKIVGEFLEDEIEKLNIAWSKYIEHQNKIKHIQI